ncbi:MAG: phosphate acyltransferase, partial [Bacteroidota bacterium]|nr:phosphate acyltransferase [Bacteroidota bacterium]
NNVLGFPYIFRGALDVRATTINEAMKLAAVKALSELTKELVPEIVNKAYSMEKITFGREYIIPKPLDPRLITAISPAVARAAIESGVARFGIDNWDKYHLELQQRVGIDQKLITRIMNQARKDPKRVVFAEGDSIKILKAAQVIQDERIAIPILLGNKKKIERIISENKLELNCTIIDPLTEEEKREKFGMLLYERRKRKGVSINSGRKLMRDRNYFGSMMLEFNEADAFISGQTKDYPSSVIPILEVIGVADGVKKVGGMYIVFNKRGTYFFADTTLNVDPTAEDLVDIIGLTAKAVRFFDFEPRIAVLSYSNFGSSKGKVPNKVKEATRLAKLKYPDLIIDGEIQANVALDTEIQKENYPFSELAEKGANTLIFPDLASGNISYKLVMEIGGAEAIGPVLMGMKKPVHILQLGSSVREIVNMVAIAVVDAQNYQSSQHL